MKKPEIEVCAYSTEDCRAAAHAGATRVELCASRVEGGISPSAAAIAAARKIKGIELSVMVRPRGGDFLYSADEFGQMLQDIEYAKQAGADGVVTGALTPDGRVDVTRTRTLVAAAAPMEVTFHRAFDMTADLGRALEDVIAAGCHRILTSGGRQTAIEGIDVIKALVKSAAGRIEIMAGSGINPSNIAFLAATGVDALHFSAAKRRESGMAFRTPYVALSAAGIPEYQIQYADADAIRENVEIVNSEN